MTLGLDLIWSSVHQCISFALRYQVRGSTPVHSLFKTSPGIHHTKFSLWPLTDSGRDSWQLVRVSHLHFNGNDIGGFRVSPASGEREVPRVGIWQPGQERDPIPQNPPFWDRQCCILVPKSVLRNVYSSLLIQLICSPKTSPKKSKVLNFQKQ